MAVRFCGSSWPGADRDLKLWREAIQVRRRKATPSDKEDGLICFTDFRDIITYFLDAAYDALAGASISRRNRRSRTYGGPDLDAYEPPWL